MDAEKSLQPSNPGEGLPTTQVNYNYNPYHAPNMQAYNAPSYPVTNTVVTIVEDNSNIKDHFLWSIFSTLYMNCCCLGFTALVYSVKSRDRMLVKDRAGAINYSQRALTLNIITTIITSAWLILMIVLMAYGTLPLFYIYRRN